MEQQLSFTTPEPIELHVELGSGTVSLDARETGTTEVVVTGPRAEEFTIEQQGRTISVVEPRQRFVIGSTARHDVRVLLPTESDLTVRTGSADTDARGRYGSVRFKSGSGDVGVEATSAATVIDCGSGDVSCGHVAGDLRIKSGSGDVEVGEALGSTGVSTGSGDVLVGRAAATTVLKTGSGDLQVQRMENDLQLNTASGDLLVRHAARGRLTVKTASGDVLLAVPAGTPVWTDISTVTGSVVSDLAEVGKPAEGQDHLEVRATSVSGDIRLQQA